MNHRIHILHVEQNTRRTNRLQTNGGTARALWCLADDALVAVQGGW